MDGDFCSGQPVRIAFSVITFMVTSCDFCRMRDQGYILQDLGADDGVFFYKVVFSSGVQPSSSAIRAAYCATR